MSNTPFHLSPDEKSKLKRIGRGSMINGLRYLLAAEDEKLIDIICEMKSLQDDLHLKHCHIKKELRDLINKAHKIAEELKNG